MEPVIQRLYLNADNMGPMPDADLVGRCGEAGMGPYMVMYLRCADGSVAAATFETYNCPVAVACGSFTARWVVGRRLCDLGVLSAHDIGVVLGGLPLGKEHCAEMAVSALRAASPSWSDREVLS